MKPIKKLLLNTLALTAVSLLMRTVGMSFSVYLSNKIGPAGIGLFELTMSVYILAVSFAVSGVRLSTTRLVVDARSRGTHSDKQVMRLCIGYALALGLTAALVLFLSARFIAYELLRAPETAPAMRILAVGLPFTAVSSCLNGYFTAKRKAARFAITQVLEQLLRIGVTVFTLGYFLPMGIEYACIALVLGSCSAEILSTSVAYGIYCAERRHVRQNPGGTPLLGKLLGIAVPDAVGSWVRSALVTAKNLLIPRGLQKSGASSQSALASYGTIHGMVLPIITFPSAFLGALSSLLIPEIAESKALDHNKHIRYIIGRVIHITLVFATATAGVLFFFAAPLGEAVYPGKQTSQFIRLLAPVIPVMYLDMMVDGVLKGLGLQVASMRYNIIDAAMCLSLVWLLVPRYGIGGYCMILYASELLNFYLSMGKLIKVTNIRLRFWRSFIAPAASAILAGFLVRPLTGGFAAHSVANLITAIAGCLGAYSFLLMLTGCVIPEDLHWLKNILKR